MSAVRPPLRLNIDTAVTFVSDCVAVTQRPPLGGEPRTIYLTPEQLREIADWVEAGRKSL